MRHVVTGLFAAGAVSALWLASGQLGDGELAFFPRAPRDSVRIGMTPLGLAAERDGFLFVPKGNSARAPAPLVIMLHGATQRARMFERIAPVADTLGVVILAPDSRDVTWDVISGGQFGPDIEFLDRAIARAFDRAHIDSCRVVVGGFSDGASYALSLGIRNARRVHGVIALSPGFVVPARPPQRLPVFMRHGTRDRILSIDRASRYLVRVLRDAGFTVDYEEFDGPHTIRPEDARAALRWASERRCS
jgi:phospholipase/carboxylesterase